jgi:hypothetical protein
MRGDDDAIEALGRGVARAQVDAVGAPAQLAHRGAQTHAPAEALQQRVDVLSRAALDRPPLRRVAQTEQAVVLEEVEEERAQASSACHRATTTRSPRPSGARKCSSKARL